MAVVMRPGGLPALWLFVLALAGCDAGHRDLRHFPDAAKVTGIALASTDQALYLAWTETPDEGPARVVFQAQSLETGQWRSPITVTPDQPPPNRVRRDNDPVLAVHGERLMLVWQTRGDGFMGAGPMVLASSDDGGRSWQAQEAPPQARETEAQGFFALTADPDGRFHLAWLDNRSGEQGLQYARTDEGHWQRTKTLDPITCQCCWNSLAHASDGTTHLLYRNRSPRDMTLLSHDGSDWQNSGRAGAFDWHFDGCPHVGGALAALNGQLHALSWTGHDEMLGLYHQQQAESGFTPPRRLGTRDARHGDLAVQGETGLLAVWDEPRNGLIRAQVLEPNGAGATPEAITLREDRERSPTRPLVAGGNRATHVIWTETDGDGRTGWVLREME